MFAHDIFISYGWSGGTRDEGAVAWVQALEQKLREALQIKLGRNPDIFIDLNSRTGPLTDTLERAIDHSRLFLFVVSPGSCRSLWCPWEILRFLERAECAATRNDVLLPEDRLFGAILEPVVKDELPGALQPLLLRPFDLTERIPESGGTVPLSWNQIDQHPSPKAEFARLTAAVATCLNKLKEHEEQPATATGVKVFLGAAPITPIEDRYLRPLRRDLLLRGHSVVRASPAPKESEDDYRIRLEPLLGQARLSVHVLSRPARPAGWQRSVGLWQLRRAGEKNKTLSRFIWEDPDETPDASEHDEILSKGDQKLDRRQDWSALSEAVLADAAKLTVIQAIQVIQSSKSVVIAYCEEDLSFVEAIRQHLERRGGFQVQLALPPRGRGGERHRINKLLFKEADALLVYYSGSLDAQEEWVYLTCIAARDATRKSPPGKPKALVLHPPPPRKDHVHHLDFQRLSRSRPDDFADIDTWASAVAAGNAS